LEITMSIVWLFHFGIVVVRIKGEKKQITFFLLLPVSTCTARTFNC
jgi:hypothetical protein